MARSRRRVRKNPAYGFLPLVPVLGVVGAGVGLYGLSKAYDLYAKLTRPVVLVGAAAGTIAGYRLGKKWGERLAYASLGTGIGIFLDNYLYPES
jgi:hypothetical protein